MDRATPRAAKPGNARPAARNATVGNRLLQPVFLKLPLVLVIMGTLVVLAPIWQGGYPWGDDSWGHLQRADYMSRMIREYGLVDGITQSAWMPEWYMGDPMFVYYPPLIVWVLGPLTALVGDVFIAYRLFISGLFLALSLSVYVIGVRRTESRWTALLGALLVVTAPFTLRTVFSEGNLPRGLALVFLPWIVWHTEEILSQKALHRSFVILAALWALAITAHVMQAVMFAIAIGLYTLFRALDGVYIPFRRVVLALLPVALGAGLAGMYILPAYSQSELSGVPYLPPSKIPQFSISWDALNPNPANIQLISIGIALVVLATLITFRSTREQHKALLATSLIAIILAFGPAGGVFRLLPMNGSLLPERFLNVTAILLPLIVATIPRGLNRTWIVLGVVIILWVDARPAYRVVQMRDIPRDEVTIAEQLATRDANGRVAVLEEPSPDAPQLFLNSTRGRRDNVSGWALENTPHQDAIRRMFSALDRAPGYLARVLSLWNTDYIVYTPSPMGRDSAFTDTLRTALEFTPVAHAGNVQLWQRPQPSAFVQRVPDNRMLVLGNNATDWLFAFPFATEGVHADPAAYDRAAFDRYTVIGMNRLPDDATIEPVLDDWVRRGNTLIVDLSGMGSLFEEGYTLFDVRSRPVSLNGNYAVTWPEGLESLPPQVPFTSPDGPWVGASYWGVDEVVAEISLGDDVFTLVGRKQVGEGQVWYVGFNLLYLWGQENRTDAIRTLADYMLAGSGVNRDLALPALAVENLERTPTHVTFDYHTPNAARAVVSMTYFPRWSARVDGKTLPLGNHEHLIALDLPAGSHTVTLDYRPLGTAIAWGGWLVSGVFAGITLAAGYLLKRSPGISHDDRLVLFSDRLPAPEVIEGQPPHEAARVPCPNCGFRLAEGGDPNDRSYPFSSMSCPICGFSLGEGSFEPGQTLRPEVKRLLAEEWLRKTGLTDSELQQGYGVARDTLFEDEPPPEREE